MPEIKSYAELIRDWEKLLAACQANATSLGSIEPIRLVLDTLLSEVRELKNRQDALTAQRQLATQELEAVKENGREAARRLRGAVKSLMGTRSEILVQFNLSPLRPRKGRKPSAPENPDTIPTPEVTPQ